MPHLDILYIRNIRPKYVNVNLLFSIVWSNEIYFAVFVKRDKTAPAIVLYK